MESPSKAVAYTQMMETASADRPIRYDGSANPAWLKTIKNKREVSNINYGRSINTLTVDPASEPVTQPRDMTRQIPRSNGGTPIGLNDPMRVARIQHNVQHVPLRAPEIIHGLNALGNSKAAVYTGTAEFFGKQQSVPGLRDTLNEDKLDSLKKDMTRINKADATDAVEIKGGLHNTSVTRTRTRKPAVMSHI